MFYRIMESFLMRLKIILDVDFYYNKDLFFFFSLEKDVYLLQNLYVCNSLIV